MGKWTAMRYLLYAIGGLAAACLFVLVSGLLIPREYQAASDLTVQAMPEAILAMLSRPEGFPGWRTDVERVESLEPGPRPGDAGAWIERHPGGTGTRHRAETSPDGFKFVDRFAAVGPAGNRGVAGGPPADSGSRAFLLVALPDGGTRIAIEERGVIDGPWDRFRARYVDGYFAGVRELAADLRKRLGE